MKPHAWFSIMLLLISCNLQTQRNNTILPSPALTCRTIEDIPVPPGYTRMKIKTNSFADWLRHEKLKTDNHVYLFNGSLKSDQSIQHAVLDEPVGNKDLQQCADAIMRLRAEYFFSKKEYDSIRFTATDGAMLSYAKWKNGTRYQLSGNRLSTVETTHVVAGVADDFNDYLETVFRFAGTWSLASALKPVRSLNEIQAGDIFIKPGFPGHAMIVTDVCINKERKKMFMLAQGFMPAQSIHIVNNTSGGADNPWYGVSGEKEIYTPSWTFANTELKRWQ